MRSFPIRQSPLLTVTAATVALPIVITTEESHNLATGDQVLIAGVQGNDTANGSHTVTVLTATTFSLDGVQGHTPMVPGTTGEAVREGVPSDVDYDADTAATGEIVSEGREMGEDATCRLVVDADQDPTVINQECDVRLYGRPDPNCEWVQLAKIDDASTWAQKTRWTSSATGLEVYPELRIDVLAKAGSTTKVRAWLIL